MNRTVVAAAGLLLGCGAGIAIAEGAEEGEMSFFITSEGPGDGANLGGLAGADLHCAELAGDDREWHAYLSADTADGEAAVDARDRIGDGPWYNAEGVKVAEDVDDLHSDNNKLSKENSLDENGERVNGRGDTPNMHDILTGSTADGTAFDDGEDHTCSNWTSNSGDGSAALGHHDRTGGGPDPTSWNSAHGSSGCGQEDLQGTGGNGLFYCFASD
ncbi:MAG TPA: hypothetical protein VNQ14_14130 [Woeseiaceae bacterium]|nr:hypothetical protein [Woeseiaceae bacterium]